jgi:DNA-binding NarL/FixJ family response regulator
MFGQMLAALLSSQFPVDVVATATTVVEACEAVDQCHPDLLILDLELADGDGLAVASHLLELQPTAKVIVLSGKAQSFVPPVAMAEALAAVIDKTRTFEVIGAAVISLLPGEAFSQPSNPCLDNLSPREHQVLNQLGMGLSSKEIAKALAVSVRTVETHRKNICAKVGLSGAQLVRIATLRRQQAALASPPSP